MDRSTIRNNFLRQFFLLLRGLTYIGLGIFIFIRKILPYPWSELLALLFVIYGGWRAYRAVMRKQADLG